MSNYSRDIDYLYADGTERAWGIKMRLEEADSEAAEAARKYMQVTPHEPVMGLVGPDFCEVCGANVQLHERIPYGERAQP